MGVATLRGEKAKATVNQARRVMGANEGGCEGSGPR